MSSRRGSGLVKTGILIEMPAGVYARIAPRSGLAVKNRIAVGGGVIDPDYDGEIKVILFNHGDEDFIVNPGDRIAQIVLERVMLIDTSIVFRKAKRGTDRGSAGFGSTGIAAAPTIGSDGKAFEFSMLRGEISLSHRPKSSGVFPPLYACVARPVNKKEQAGNAKAKAALQKEWDKLTSQGCWDLSTVQEWHDVAARARKEGEKIHVGRIFDICVEKNHELPEDDPNRKYKGRVVFEGCFVRDEIGHWALFSENTSCPATMAAGKMGDAHGLLPGNLLEVSDGESAYTQARLKGKKTWVRIPRDQWPPGWFAAAELPGIRIQSSSSCSHYMDIRTLVPFGKKVGYVKVKDWASVFRHEALDLFLVVYVDDFKMSGPAKNIAEEWALISKVIKMEEPRQLKRYLGCEHEFTQQVVKGHFDPRLAWTVAS